MLWVLICLINVGWIFFLLLVKMLYVLIILIIFIGEVLRVKDGIFFKGDDILSVLVVLIKWFFLINKCVFMV